MTQKPALCCKIASSACQIRTATAQVRAATAQIPGGVSQSSRSTVAGALGKAQDSGAPFASASGSFAQRAAVLPLPGLTCLTSFSTANSFSARCSEARFGS